MVATIPMEEVSSPRVMVEAEDRLPVSSTSRTEEILPTMYASSSHPASIPAPVSPISQASPEFPSPSTQTLESQSTSASSPHPTPIPAPEVPTTSPPAYSPPTTSTSSPRSLSPPPPPLPPSPVLLPPRTLPATRPASFPLLGSLAIPSCTPRPYTFHQPPPTSLSPSHSVAIDIFPDTDTQPTAHEEPLPTYSRYPKHGEAHCMGEIAGDSRSIVSWDGGSRSSSRRRDQETRRILGRKKMCCGEGVYMRNVITGIVVLIVACVIAGGVVGWQMKANFENVPDSGPQSTPFNDDGQDGNVDYWYPPTGGDATHTMMGPGGVVLQPASTASETGSIVWVSMRMTGPTATGIIA